MFLGWRIVGLAFLTNFVSVGFLFYSYGVFFKALAADFGGSRFGVSLGLYCLQLVTALSAPFVGQLLDRGLIRRVMTAGALLMGVGFVVASTITSLWQFYVVIGSLLGVGVCMLGGLSSATLVANWFVGRRGMALGLATMGISVSGVLMPPIGTALIEAVGWRHTFLVYAAFAGLVVAPAIWLFIVNRPEDVGQHPDGESPVGGHTTASRQQPPATRRVLSSRNYWVISGVIALNFCCMGAVLTHAVPHVTDLGYGATPAALVLSAMAGAGSLGKPLFGWLIDNMDKRLALGIATFLQLVGVEILLHTEAYPLLLLGGTVFGLGMGGIVPIHGSLVGAAFGRDAFGRVMGMMSPTMLPVSSLGVPVAGFIYDSTGSYDAAYRAFTVIYVVSIGVLSLLRLPEFEPGREPPPAEQPAA